MSFKDKTFAERYSDRMWHHSEDFFEQRWEHLWDRFGLDQDQARVSTWAMDPFVRHSPDYISQLHERGTPFFVEVQGTGKDQTHKFKLEKLDVLTRWNRVHDVWLWLWNDRAKRETVISLNRLQLLIAQGKASKDSFDGGKRPYWALPVSLIETSTDWNDSKGRYE